MVLRKKGFTLIELLVVIAIIAMLLAILMPALGMAKEKAKSIVCRSNLKQWGIAYTLYAADNGGKFPATNWLGTSESWMEQLRGSYGDVSELLFCPSAPKIFKDVDPDDPATWTFGEKNKGWKMINNLSSKPIEMGSYGENPYVRIQTSESAKSYGGAASLYWKGDGRSNASSVPVVMDSRWFNMLPTYSAASPVDSDGQPIGMGDWSAVSIAVMRRHGKGINALFLDGTAGGVDAEDMWNLRWNKEWEPMGRIELARDINEIPR